MTTPRNWDEAMRMFEEGKRDFIDPVELVALAEAQLETLRKSPPAEPERCGHPTKSRRGAPCRNMRGFCVAHEPAAKALAEQQKEKMVASAENYRRYLAEALACHRWEPPKPVYRAYPPTVLCGDPYLYGSDRPKPWVVAVLGPLPEADGERAVYLTRAACLHQDGYFDVFTGRMNPREEWPSIEVPPAP